MLRTLLKKNKAGLVLLVLVLSFPVVLFLLVPRNVAAPDQDFTQLNLGRSPNIMPIERVALPSAAKQLAENNPALQNTPTALSNALPFATATGTLQAIRPSVAAITPTVKAASNLAFPKLFPVKLELPAAHINTAVVESYLDQNDAIYVPLLEAGHYIGSARPGEKGNMVFVGHVRRGLVFNHLIGAKLDDLISIYDEAGKHYDYKVAQIELIPVSGASKEQISQGLLYTSQTTDERISLITCYPETSYANRLVVIGIPVKAGS